jgi:hypothetical protein
VRGVAQRPPAPAFPPGSEGDFFRASLPPARWGARVLAPYGLCVTQTQLLFITGQQESRGKSLWVHSPRSVAVWNTSFVFVSVHKFIILLLNFNCTLMLNFKFCSLQPYFTNIHILQPFHCWILGGFRLLKMSVNIFCLNMIPYCSAQHIGESGDAFKGLYIFSNDF